MHRAPTPAPSPTARRQRSPLLTSAAAAASDRHWPAPPPPARPPEFVSSVIFYKRYDRRIGEAHGKSEFADNGIYRGSSCFGPTLRNTGAQCSDHCMHIQVTFPYSQGHFRPQVLGTPQNQCALRPKMTVIPLLIRFSQRALFLYRHNPTARSTIVVISRVLVCEENQRIGAVRGVCFIYQWVVLTPQESNPACS